MLYKKLAEIYESLSNTTKRLEKIDILSEFIKSVSEKDKDVLYLLLGRVFPEYSEKKIGISSQLAIQAISKSTGVEKKEVVKEWKKTGDLGKVAEELISKKKQSTLKSRILTAEKVLANIRKLPELEGKGTVSRKLSLITELLTSASPIEAKYLVRTLIGDLRIGVQESTVRDSMAKAFFNNKKESAEKIQRALDRTNDIGDVFVMAKRKNLKELESVKIEVGRPVKVMLAQKALSISEGFKKLGKPCAIEYKYDGFRMIIHKKKNSVSIFTRRLENVTRQFPEVVDYVNKYVKGKNFILDSEAVGWDRKTKEYQPFQRISQRIKRKHNIEKLQKELPVEVNVFDILYYNGKSLIDTPYRERAELIRKIVKKTPYKIIPSKMIITSNEKKAERFFKSALKDNQEGIMMKSLNAVYQPGKRVGHMLKVKPEEKELDLVITGAEYGAGKRKGWMSSFILSCRGRKKGEFLEIGKVGTGIKEKTSESGGVSFEELTKILSRYVTEEKGKKVKIKPKVVVSVTYQEIQKSPNYSSGWALRFPRFIALRPDKPLSETADLKEIEEDFKNQKRNWRYG